MHAYIHLIYNFHDTYFKLTTHPTFFWNSAVFSPHRTANIPKTSFRTPATYPSFHLVN